MNVYRPTIVLATYEERDNIGPLIRRLVRVLEPRGDFEILVVDDDSPDGTAAAARDAAAGDPRIRVDIRTSEKGLASAIRYGLERIHGDCAVVMNTDFQHEPDLVPRMIERLADHDVVIGSRFIPGGGMSNPFRYWPSRFFSLFLRRRLGVDVRDQTSGFVAFRAEIVRALNSDDTFHGHGDWFFRMLHTGRRAGWRIIEVPAYYPPRRAGRRKSRLVSMLVSYARAAIELPDIRPPATPTG